jgi:hypothetical protein
MVVQTGTQTDIESVIQTGTHKQDGHPESGVPILRKAIDQSNRILHADAEPFETEVQADGDGQIVGRDGAEENVDHLENHFSNEYDLRNGEIELKEEHQNSAFSHMTSGNATATARPRSYQQGFGFYQLESRKPITRKERGDSERHEV